MGSPALPEGPGRARALIERIETLRRGDPAGAWVTLGREFAGATRGAGAHERGELWRLRGHVLRALQRMRPAAGAYARAERWFARAGDAREQGRCAIGLVDALMYLSRYAEAARAARRGRRLLARAHDRVSLAKLLNQEGNVFHRLDLPERALERYREARRSLARAGDARGAATVSGNVANCLALLGRLPEARRLYLEARRANQRAGFAFEALNAEYNLAYLDFLEHRYEEALDGLGRVRAQAGPRGYPWLGGLASLDRAEILLRMGAHDEALAESRQAVETCGEAGLRYERAKAETFAALAEFHMGRGGAARERLERTLGTFHREGNQVWAGEALVGLATLAWHAGNPRAAAALLSAARRRFARAGDREREGCALALLARTWLECGERAAAAACLARVRPGRAGRGLERLSPRLRHLVLATEAALCRARGDLAGARTRLREAARESERLAARILDEHWRATFWGEWGWPHRELAALELEGGRLAEALEALEGGRGRALVGRAHARRARGGPFPAIVRRWAAGRLARERERIARTDAPALTGGGTGRAAGDAGLRRALDSFAPRTIRAAALRRSLPGGTLLLDYLVHDGSLQVIALSRDGMTARAGLATEAHLSRLVHALLFSLRSAAFASPAERRPDPLLGEVLTSLAGAVLWPALPKPGSAHFPRRLMVVPVGPLARLPWAALPLPDGRPLCEALELTIVPGLRLGLARGPASEPGGAPLVVAADAGELASVEPETRAILGLFREARLLAGPEATAARFLELAPSAPWIHFAGHGYYQAEAPHESGLRLADRWLLAGELAGLRLPAHWVTLSACQTARALVRPGEEWFGLARSLLLAGAGAVVASQWDVEDAAAARLMEAMYLGLARGECLGAALAGAQAAAFWTGSHPLDWAGFVLLAGPGGPAAGGIPDAKSASKAAAHPPVAVDME